MVVALKFTLFYLCTKKNYPHFLQSYFSMNFLSIYLVLKYIFGWS